MLRSDALEGPTSSGERGACGVDAYTVAEFLALAPFGRSRLYELWAQDRGPVRELCFDRLHPEGRVLLPKRDALEWLREWPGKRRKRGPNRHACNAC